MGASRDAVVFRSFPCLRGKVGMGANRLRRIYKFLYNSNMGHARKPVTSVWDAIADTPEQAENMRLRADLMQTLRQHIQDNGWSQTDAATRLGVTQPRISDLVRGKISLFSLDSLIRMAVSAGLHVSLRIEKAA